MSARQHIANALFVGLCLASAACGDDPTPNAQLERDGAIAAVGATGGSDAASGTDSGSAAAADAGAASRDAGASTSSASDASGSDGATASANDAGAADAGSDAGASADAGASGDAGAPGGAFTLLSPAFANAAGCSKDMPSPCKVFPEENVSYMKNAASETENISPELTWTGVPAGTKSFAVVLQDLTNGMAHWVLWNIPGTATKLDKNVAKSSAMPAQPAGAQQCSLGLGGDGYFGPGSRCNVYEFVVYALARPMFSPTSATDAGQVRTQLQALNADILGTAWLRGRANYMMMCRD